MSLTITCEDNMALMARLKDKEIDIAIVDPPYGIDINMNMGLKKGQVRKHDKKDWDKGIPGPEYFAELERVSKFRIIWGGNYFPLPLTGSWIFWDKMVPQGVSFADGELAWTSGDKTLVKAQVKYTGFQGMDEGGKIHPTQKPVALYSWLLEKYAKPGDKILDTHLGSGSIAIACYNHGHDLIACELDPDYYAAAMKRIEKHTQQSKLFF